MNTRKIRSLEKRAIKEAQKAVNGIFAKYSKEIVLEIRKQIPKGYSLSSWNGMVSVNDNTGKEIRYGNAWSRTSIPDAQFDYIASLQYGTQADDLQGSFDIPDVIKGTKL